MSGLLAPIPAPRVSLVALTPDLLAAMAGDRDGVRPFAWPSWWPDERDRGHRGMGGGRAGESELDGAWGPRAVVDADGGCSVMPGSTDRRCRSSAGSTIRRSSA